MLGDLDRGRFRQFDHLPTTADTDASQATATGLTQTDVMLHPRWLLPTSGTMRLSRPFLARFLLALLWLGDVRLHEGWRRRLLLFSFLNAKLGGGQLLLQCLHLRQGLLELLFEPRYSFFCSHVARISDKAQCEQYRYLGHARDFRMGSLV